MKITRQKSWIYAAVVLFVVVLIGLIIISLRQPYTFNGSLIVPSTLSGNIVLANYDRRVFNLSEQRGKVVLVFFGYTSCPDVCPTTLADFKQIRTGLDKKAGEVDFVFISVDPERDTAERIGKYVPAFDPTFWGLRGSPETLAPIFDAYGVFVEKQESASANGYLVSHTARVYVIDKSGNLRLTFPYGTPPDAMLEDVSHLVTESTE